MVDPDAKFARLGLDSANSLYLIVELEEWLAIELTPDLVFEYPTIAELARHLAKRWRVKSRAERFRPPGAATAVEAASLVDVLRSRAADQPNDVAYIFRPDRSEPLRLTFADLYGGARAVATRLVERGQKGDRAALLFPPGLDFIIAFFGCLLAGVVAVPMMIPRRDSSRD